MPNVVVDDPLDRLIAQDAAAAAKHNASGGQRSLGCSPRPTVFYRPVVTPTHIGVSARSRGLGSRRRYRRSLNQRLLYAVFRRLLDAEGSSENATALSVASVSSELASIPHEYSWARLREDEETSVIICECLEDDGASSSGSSTSTGDRHCRAGNNSPLPKSVKSAAVKGSFTIKRLLAKNAIGMGALVQLLEKILFQEFFNDVGGSTLPTLPTVITTPALETSNVISSKSLVTVAAPTVSFDFGTPTTDLGSASVAATEPTTYESPSRCGISASGYSTLGADGFLVAQDDCGNEYCGNSDTASSKASGASDGEGQLVKESLTHYIFEFSNSSLAARRLTEAQAADADASLSANACNFMRNRPRVVLWGLTRLQRCLVHRAAPRIRLCAYSDDQGGAATAASLLSPTAAANGSSDDWKPLVLACCLSSNTR